MPTPGEREAAKSLGIRQRKISCNGGLCQEQRDTIEEAAQVARDAAIVVAGLSDYFESEGYDRPDTALPGRQDELIEAVAESNENTIVVLNAGTQIVMTRWLDKVAGLIVAGYPGQEGGHALGEILFGDVNPSGKLPITMPKLPEDHSGHGHYPGENGVVRFGEGIFVGYRHFVSRGYRAVVPIRLRALVHLVRV